MIHSQMTLDSSMINAGALLGTTGRPELISSINAACIGSSYFGSEYDPNAAGFQQFLTKVIEPARRVQQAMIEVEKNLLIQEYKAITSEQILAEGIPERMWVPIVLYAPIRKQLEEERITGFGIDPKNLPDEDYYATMINNGSIELHDGNIPKDGTVEVTEVLDSTFPEISDKDLEAIYLTRKYIDEFISSEDTRHLDFTDYPSLKC